MAHEWTQSGDMLARARETTWLASMPHIHQATACHSSYTLTHKNTCVNIVLAVTSTLPLHEHGTPLSSPKAAHCSTDPPS